MTEPIPIHRYRVVIHVSDPEALTEALAAGLLDALLPTPRPDHAERVTLLVAADNVYEAHRVALAAVARVGSSGRVILAIPE